jgi:PTH1 family peptidyl-tRNA hydrolase
MNLSGEPVALLVKYFKIESTQDLLIVVDDVALPFGKFRLRGEGSSGGHNGLVSIEEHLGSREYPRLRIGIGVSWEEGVSGPARIDGPLRDYVLSSFESREEKQMKKNLKCGMDACRAWVLGPLTKAMNRVNSVRS